MVGPAKDLKAYFIYERRQFLILEFQPKMGLIKAGRNFIRILLTQATHQLKLPPVINL